MYFTIKEMARQLGVTPNKLRYYEQVGLIKPRTNERTGYRYYSVRDTRRFNATRLYRSFGLSISECKEYLSVKDHPSLMDALDEQENRMQNEITYQIDKLKAFLFWKPFISNVLLDVGVARPIRFPTVYRITISESEKLINDKARSAYFEKWLEVFPVCSWASRIKMSELIEANRPELYDYGLIMPEPDIKKYGLYEERFIERIEGGTYIYTVFTKDTDLPFDLGPLKIINPYLEEHGMHIAGDGFSNCIYSTEKNGNVVNYHYFMVKAESEKREQN